jgi:HEAT repeat protein
MGGARDAIEGLRPLLDSSGEQRWMALFAIGASGPEGARFALTYPVSDDDLEKAISCGVARSAHLFFEELLHMARSHPTAVVRRRALMSIVLRIGLNGDPFVGLFGQWGRIETPPLDQILSANVALEVFTADPDPEVRRAAISVLLVCKPEYVDLTSFANAIQRELDADIRAFGVHVLGRCSTDNMFARQVLVEMLSDPSEQCRMESALMYLRKWPSRFGDAESTLRRLFRSDDQMPRLMALRAVCAAGTNAKPLVRDLLALTRHEDVETRWWAATALGPIGVTTDAVVERLVAMVHEELGRPKDESAFGGAVLALGELAPQSDDAVDALIEALQRAGNESRWHVIHAFHDYGPKARRAVPALRELIGRQDEGHAARADAFEALKAIDPTAARELVEQGEFSP